MYATLSNVLSFFITSSPMTLLGISVFFEFLSFLSISSTTFSIASWDIGLFSQAFRKPFLSFSIENGSLLPSFLITTSGFSSILSYVVNLLPHFKHSLRLLVASPAGLGLLSRTLLSVLLQN